VPNLKDIRRRISSVKSTQKITRAMKMVAGARLRKAQQNIEQLRPYAKRTIEVLSAIASRAEQTDHPLLARREPPKKTLLVVLTSDRGLCGGFNSNINRVAEKEARSRTAAGGEAVVLDIIGRKGRDYLRRRPVTIRRELTGVFEGLSYAKAGEIGRDIVREYTSGGFDAVYLIYNEFKSVVTQKVVVEQLLPLQPEELKAGETATEFIYEPDKQALLDRLPVMYVELEVYRALLESVASELGARMTAMENATKNADEMIGTLTLQANRARQAGITKELLEVVAGAAGLMK
jgi:F-type H+-transporting ATPase subunit gamma